MYIKIQIYYSPNINGLDYRYFIYDNMCFIPNCLSGRLLINYFDDKLFSEYKNIIILKYEKFKDSMSGYNGTLNIFIDIPEEELLYIKLQGYEYDYEL